jgi:hypothetical protein
MSEKKVEMGVRLNTEQAHAKLQAFGRGMKNTFSNINRMADATSRHFGMVATTISALGSGLVLKKLFSVKEFAAFDDSMLRMRANAKLTVAEMAKFRDDLNKLISAEGMPRDEAGALAAKLSNRYKPDEILTMLGEADRLSDVKKVPLSDSLAVIDRIMKIYKQTPKQAREIVDSVIAANVELSNLDMILQRGMLKGSASKEYKEVLAIVSGLAKAGAESGRSVLAIETLLNVLERKEKTLKGAGIDIFKIDPKSGKKVEKNAIEILEELGPKVDAFRKKHGKQALFEDLEKNLGPGAGEGVPLMLEHLPSIKAAYKQQANAAAIAEPKAAAANDTWEESFNRIKETTAGIKEDVSFIYDIVKKPIKWLADNPTATKTATWTAGLAALGLGGGLLYSKGKGAVGAVKELFKGAGGLGAGVAMGKALEETAGVKPVFIAGAAPGVFGPLAGGAPDVPLKSLGLLAGGITFLITGALLEKEARESNTPEEFAMKNPESNDVMLDGDSLVLAKLFSNTLDTLNDQSIAQGAYPVEEPRVDNKIDIRVNVDQNGRAITTVEGKNTEVQVMAENRGSFR